MRRTLHVIGALIVALASIGSAYARSAVPWTTLNVKADSDGTSGNGSDNADALNHLLDHVPPGTTIKGDCKDVNGNDRVIRIAGRWLLQSNLKIVLDQGCRVACDWITAGKGGCISQADLNTPLTNVSIEGLHFVRANPNFLGRGLQLWIDHLTMKSLTIDGFYSMATLRGGDQEWASPSFINSPGGAGNVATGTTTAGFHHLGNLNNGVMPATTAGRPANVWLHDGYFEKTGDGALQVGPPCQVGTDWTSISSDSYLYENTTVNSDNGNMILIATGAQDGTQSALSCDHVTVKNILIRNITGTTKTSVIRIQHANNPDGIFQNITIRNVTGDNDAGQSASGAVLVRGYDHSPMSDILLSDIRVMKQFGNCLDLGAAPATGLIFDNLVCDIPKSGALATAVVRSTTGTVIRNSTLPSLNGGGIELGPNRVPACTPTNCTLPRRINDGDFQVTAPRLLNNTFSNVGNAGLDNSGAAIRLRNVAGGRVGNNILLRNPAATDAVGISLQPGDTTNPGTTDIIVSGNTLPEMNAPTNVICAPSQGNTVNNNTDARPPHC